MGRLGGPQEAGCMHTQRLSLRFWGTQRPPRQSATQPLPRGLDCNRCETLVLAPHPSSQAPTP